FLAPKHAETWLVTSELLTTEEHYATALSVLDNVRAKDPMAAAARGQRLELLVKQGDRETALAEALAMTRKGTVQPGDWTRVGGLYSELGRPADAAGAYRNALILAEAKPDEGTRWTLLLLLGSALHEAGDWPGARAALEKALALAPDEAVVLNYLGYAQLERRENLAEAQKLIEKASALKPEDAAITDSLGWTHYVRGNVPKAIELLERAVADEPGEPTMNEHLGDAYWTAGRRI
ncbi:MAG: tetratricopeptide repeat protein, partial [Sphingomonadaceae bacterium]